MIKSLFEFETKFKGVYLRLFKKKV